ncbi:acetyl-CoA carboxylase biotin carboxyl carrier protein [Thermosulfidibacter takaii ABI70S6]|uniref:Acetyl-CoA carboxylase biotin carboxyl carrier protein n=1 Tax=Thermosulfidibacter takaii (strain DSM 17441 / JCM 13301 / NBRC 103674 / ABI70S6) TaxID=1298851 RepID=A0A0S3QVL3_THET7|nr:biotin/lipoyl-containing protein [Thermosulfidibacter takaii]BAT72368.1 acetyl-CoA carboxylase biotin carboxyl carrier protein [Thermosulfidibacter takaii ABI70S6]
MAEIISPMAGVVAEVKVNPGDTIEPGQEILIMESMKMMIPLEADKGGVVKEVKVNVGDFVNEGDVVVVLED